MKKKKTGWERSRRYSAKMLSEFSAAFGRNPRFSVTPTMFTTLDHCIPVPVGSTHHSTLFKWKWLLFTKMENSVVVAECPLSVFVR